MLRSLLEGGAGARVREWHVVKLLNCGAAQRASRADHKEGRHELAGFWNEQEARVLAAPFPCACALQGPDSHKQTLDFVALRFLRRGREGGEARGVPGGLSRKRSDQGRLLFPS